MSKFIDIRGALLQAYTDAAFGISTAYENQKYTPVAGTPWAQINIVPSQPEPAAVGTNGSDEHNGFMQIDLNYPLEDGTFNALTMAESIAATFKPGAKFTRNSQTVTIRSSGISVGRVIDGWYNVIMTIVYYSRIQRA